MSGTCSHVGTIRAVAPSARGCEDCLKAGITWFHLRVCRACGHVGCCDQWPDRHATAHFHATKHPIIEGYDPPEVWAWCAVDEALLDVGDDTTPQDGPIPRYDQPGAARQPYGARTPGGRRAALIRPALACAARAPARTSPRAARGCR